MGNDVLIVHGSPRRRSFSSAIADAVAGKLAARGIGAERVLLRELRIGPCLGCDGCRRDGRDLCVVQDDMQGLYGKIKGSRAILIAGPVYWFSVNSIVKAFIDRLYGLHTETTRVLEGKRFGLVLAYGDEDAAASGVANAIRMYQDAFRYTASALVGVVHCTEAPGHEIGGELQREVDALAEALGGGRG